MTSAIIERRRLDADMGARTADDAPDRPAHAAISPTRARGLLLGLLTLTGGLYSIGIGAMGWANYYYSAAAQAGSMSWHAFLFGALDPTGGITVDKPPAALWLMGLSVRAFGLSPQALLLPQAACAVAAVGLLYLTVRRQAGPVAGLVAGLILAVTPVVTLLARDDNPDMLMTLLLVAAGYATTRSVQRERGGTGWLVLTGALVGTAFLTKQAQALLVVPALALLVLVAAPWSLRRRLTALVAGGLAMVVAAGWWVALVQLTPASQRPYVGGSRHNSILELTFGYNGLGRLTGQESGGGFANRTRSGSWLRLFGSGGDQAGWLLPAALILLVAAAVLLRRAGRQHPQRAGLVLWGAWLLGVGVVLSGLQGISHSYYMIELAPAVAALVAIGGQVVWTERDRRPWARPVLAGAIALSASYAIVLIVHRPAWTLVAVPVVAVTGALAVMALWRGDRLAVRLRSGTLLGVTLVALLAGPTVWSVATAQSIHRGSSPVAGPGVTSVLDRAGIVPNTRVPVALAEQLQVDAGRFDWAGVMVGRHAADLQLATGVSIRELGGYSGNGPNPSLTQFQELVAAGRVHYLALDTTGENGASGSAARQVVDWALAHHPATRIDGWTLVDLTQASGRQPA